MKTNVKILKAEYFENYKLKIFFSDGHVNIFDYENLIKKGNQEGLKYQNVSKFKKFQIIDEREIAWGKNWEMILPIETIYNKQKVNLSGRKKITDKIISLRVYVKDSVIKSSGGYESAQKKCADFLNSEPTK